MNAGQQYSSYTRQSSHCVDISRAMFGGSPTPLHDVVAPRLADLPGDIAAQLRREFWKRHGDGKDWDRKYYAQDWLTNQVAEFEREKIGLAFDEHEIRTRAARWAELCGKMQSLEVMQDFGRSVGINPPEVRRDVTRVGAARRMACPRWWRRQIRKAYTRRAESHLRAAGFVHRRRQVYASDRAVSHRRERKARDRAMLQEMVAVSDAGDQLELWDVVTKSQANPALRRAELMTRLSGFEDVAKAAAHEALFVTLTTPSAFHRTLDNGTKNPHWEGFAPRQGQDWLCKMWARSRSKLRRVSASFYGFRIAEPHHDGTPHWHMVLFGAPSALEKVRDVLRLVWLSEYAKEAGAQKYRVKFERIRPEVGSATGYLAKYVAKNIDGFEVGDDYEAGQKATESCDRVAAWASAHGVRQFQQIGGPPVSVWRELRRIRSSVNGNQAIEVARKAADAGEWADFITAIGGIASCGAKSRAVRLWLERTGELNQYDELRAPQISGVESSTGKLRTRVKVWRIERKKRNGEPSMSAADNRSGSASSLGPVSITVRARDFMPPATIAGNLKSSPREGPPWMH